MGVNELRVYFLTAFKIYEENRRIHWNLTFKWYMSKKISCNHREKFITVKKKWKKIEKKFKGYLFGKQVRVEVLISVQTLRVKQAENTEILPFNDSHHLKCLVHPGRMINNNNKLNRKWIGQFKGIFCGKQVRNVC